MKPRRYHGVKRAAAALRGPVRAFFTGREEGIRGVAAIEFAILAASMTLMMVCVVDFGMGLYRKMQVQNAAQAGAQYAAIHGFSAGSISSAVTSATSFSGVAASPAPSQFCGCPNNDGVAVVECSAVCGDGSTPGAYVLVSAAGSYDTILGYPGIPKTFALTAESRVRLQ
jgi:Flp pilus assembly protein TadG